MTGSSLLKSVLAWSSKRFSVGAERRGKPESFDFRGFTHVCGKTRKGYPSVRLRLSA